MFGTAYKYYPEFSIFFSKMFKIHDLKFFKYDIRANKDF